MGQTGNHACQMGSAARSGDDDTQTAILGTLRPLHQGMCRTVRRDDAFVHFDTETLKSVDSCLHNGQVAYRAHDNSYSHNYSHSMVEGGLDEMS